MIQETCRKLQFPEEAISCLSHCYQKILTTDHALDLLYQAMDPFFLEDTSSYEQFLDKVSHMTGIHRYSVDMVFLLLSSKSMRYLYHEKGYTEEFYWANLSDLKNKLMECKMLHNIWGTRSCGWFRGIYTCVLFLIGRLQFEMRTLPVDDYKGIAKRGDAAIKVHIPSCGPLLQEDAIRSFELAKEFFKEYFVGKPTVFYCGTWLLYPRHYHEVYTPGSNLCKFYELFDIVDSSESPDNHDFWRVFYQSFREEEIDSLLENTSLQRNFKKYLKAGNLMGIGMGIRILE